MFSTVVCGFFFGSLFHPISDQEKTEAAIQGQPLPWRIAARGLAVAPFIRKGMTTDQVEAFLGEPSFSFERPYVRTVWYAGLGIEVWYGKEAVPGGKNSPLYVRKISALESGPFLPGPFRPVARP